MLLSKDSIIVFEGPDGCGKTEISQAVAKELGLPYFKVNSERKNWAGNTFKNSLWFDATLPQFVKATGQGFVGDRGWPSEYVYSDVFKRDVDLELLERADDEFAAAKAIVVLLLRKDYSGSRFDDLIPAEKLQKLHDRYLEFAEWTECSVVKMYVDEFQNDLGLQLPRLLNSLVMTHNGTMKTYFTVV